MIKCTDMLFLFLIILLFYCRLPKNEQKRVEEILNKALKKERGEPIDDVAPDDEEEG